MDVMMETKMQGVNKAVVKCQYKTILSKSLFQLRSKIVKFYYPFQNHHFSKSSRN